MRRVAISQAARSYAEFLRQPVAEIGGCKKQLQPVSKLTEAKVIEFLPQLVAEIPWGHHRLILDKLTNPAARLYYLRATARFGWSRNVLLNQIKANAYERAVKQKEIEETAAPFYGITDIPSIWRKSLSKVAMGPSFRRLATVTRAASVKLRVVFF